MRNAEPFLSGTHKEHETRDMHGVAFRILNQLNGVAVGWVRPKDAGARPMNTILFQIFLLGSTPPSQLESSAPRTQHSSAANWMCGYRTRARL